MVLLFDMDRQPNPALALDELRARDVVRSCQIAVTCVHVLDCWLRLLVFACVWCEVAAECRPCLDTERRPDGFDQASPPHPMRIM